jgi:UDP-N-acetylglucosamine--N-acetylmuramyl-(pentapeptide) pyrophosphoryl-undecaprenol N-acetylglucosamine transferase
VFPALAIRQAIAQRDPNAVVMFVGTRRGIESKVIPQAGETLKTIWISGFSRNHLLQNVLLPLKLMTSLFQSLRLLLSFHPDVVVGTGGYVTGPLIWTAQRLRIPTLLQEQNSYPGWTTRALAKRATVVCIGFADARGHIHSTRVHFTGNPLRHSFRTLSRVDAKMRWSLDPMRKTLLALGGSLGARSINEAISLALSRIIEKYNLIWQTGRLGIPSTADQSVIQQALREQHLDVRTFIDDMPGAYAMADLAVCRAGAMTLAELAAVGLPAILVPFPFATNDHQTVNAQSVVAAGAARLIPDRSLTSDLLISTVEEFLSSDTALQTTSAAMKSLARPDAALDIADLTISAAKRTA